MKTFYKVFLVILIIFTGINIYAINWTVGAFDPINNKFWFSITAGVVGIILALILHSLSKLETKKN